MSGSGAASRASRPKRRCRSWRCDDHSFTLGGSGNVANNLRALGAAVTFVGVVGDDAEGERVRTLFAAIDCDTCGLARRSTTGRRRARRASSRTTSKSCARIGNRPRRSRAADRARVVDAVRRAAGSADAVVLSDYAKGLLHRDIVEAALAAPVVVADPKPDNVDLFAGVTCIAPNATEAARASGIAIVDDASLERAARALLERLQCRYVLITRGEHGMSLFGRDGERERHSVGRAHGVRRQRRRRYGRRRADAGAGRARADRSPRRGLRTSPPAPWSKNSAPRRPRRPRSSR